MNLNPFDASTVAMSAPPRADIATALDSNKLLREKFETGAYFAALPEASTWSGAGEASLFWASGYVAHGDELDRVASEMAADGAGLESILSRVVARSAYAQTPLGTATAVSKSTEVALRAVVPRTLGLAPSVFRLIALGVLDDAVAMLPLMSSQEHAEYGRILSDTRNWDDLDNDLENIVFATRCSGNYGYARTYMEAVRQYVGVSGALEKALLYETASISYSAIHEAAAAGIAEEYLLAASRL